MASALPRTVREADARYATWPLPNGTLVDSCILIDVLADDARWAEWSLEQLERAGQHTSLVINPLILAEVSPRFERAADLETALAGLPLVRQPPYKPQLDAPERAPMGVPGKARGRGALLCARTSNAAWRGQRGALGRIALSPTW